MSGSQRILMIVLVLLGWAWMAYKMTEWVSELREPQVVIVPWLEPPPYDALRDLFPSGECEQCHDRSDEVAL